MSWSATTHTPAAYPNVLVRYDSHPATYPNVLVRYGSHPAAYPNFLVRYDSHPATYPSVLVRYGSHPRVSVRPFDPRPSPHIAVLNLPRLFLRGA